MELELEVVQDTTTNPDQGLLVSPLHKLESRIEELAGPLAVQAIQYFLLLAGAYCLFLFLRKVIFRPFLHDFAYGKKHKH